MVKNMSRFPLSTLLQLIIIIIREEGRLPLPLSTSEYYMERPLKIVHLVVLDVFCALRPAMILLYYM